METKDNREQVDIKQLNAEISKTVEKINALRISIDEIIKEHIELSASFLSLAQAAVPEKVLHQLGEKLITHIRKEERVLFPLIETSCTDQLLEEIKGLQL